MKLGYTALLLPVLIACAPAAHTGMSGAMIPVGTMITVQLDQPVGGNLPSLNATPLTATVVDAVRTPTGATMIAAGTTLEGAVTGYYEGGGALPEMVGLEFTRINFGDVSHPIVAEVVSVDLALADNDSATPTPDRALVGTPPAHTHGAVIVNAAEFLRENELGPIQGTVISLGTDRGATLPMGTRLTLRVIPEPAM
jgi:hypothetical protein